MNEKDKLEKKLFAITAVLLTVFGAVVGLYTAEFLSGYFVTVSMSQRIISYSLTSAILALIMMSLSKPVCALLKKAMEGTQNYLTTRPVYKSMNIVFGMILGISIAIFTSSILTVTAPKLKGSIHFVIVSIAFFVVTYVSARLFNAIIGNEKGAVKFSRGYVIASSAFKNDKVLKLVPKLIGKIAVMDVTANALAQTLADCSINGEDVTVPKQAFDNYNQLKKILDVKIANGDVQKTELENLTELALNQKLKIIALDRMEMFDDDKVDVLYLSEL